METYLPWVRFNASSHEWFCQYTHDLNSWSYYRICWWYNSSQLIRVYLNLWYSHWHAMPCFVSFLLSCVIWLFQHSITQTSITLDGVYIYIQNGRNSNKKQLVAFDRRLDIGVGRGELVSVKVLQFKDPLTLLSLPLSTTGLQNKRQQYFSFSNGIISVPWSDIAWGTTSLSNISREVSHHPLFADLWQFSPVLGYNSPPGVAVSNLTLVVTVTLTLTLTSFHMTLELDLCSAPSRLIP